MMLVSDPQLESQRRRLLEDIHDAFDTTGVGLVSTEDLMAAGLEVPPSQSEWPITEFVAMMLRATAQCDAAAFDSGTNHLMKAAHRMRCSLIADDDPADLAAEAEQLRGRLEELEEEHTAVQRAVEVEFEAQGRTAPDPYLVPRASARQPHTMRDALSALADREREIESNEATIEALTSKVATLEARLRHESEIAPGHGSVSVTGLKVVEGRSRSDTLQRIEGLETQGQSEVDKLKAANGAAEVEEALAGMEKLAGHWKELCGELEEEVNEASGEIMELEARCAALVDEKASAEEEMSRQQEACETAVAREEEVKEQIRILRAQHHALQCSFEDLEHRLEKEKTLHEAALSRMEQLHAEAKAEGGILQEQLEVQGAELAAALAGVEARQHEQTWPRLANR